MSFYVNRDSPLCKICGKNGYDTSLCFPVVMNYLTFDEISTPDKMLAFRCWLSVLFNSIAYKGYISGFNNNFFSVKFDDFEFHEDVPSDEITFLSKPKTEITTTNFFE